MLRDIDVAYVTHRYMPLHRRWAKSTGRNVCNVCNVTAQALGEIDEAEEANRKAEEEMKRRKEEEEESGPKTAAEAKVLGNRLLGQGKVAAAAAAYEYAIELLDAEVAAEGQVEEVRLAV